MNKNNAANSGKHWRSRDPTSPIFQRRDFSVSSRARGAETKTSDAQATTAIATDATARLRVMKSAAENTAATAIERSAWLMPAR